MAQRPSQAAVTFQRQTSVQSLDAGTGGISGGNTEKEHAKDKQMPLKSRIENSSCLYLLMLVNVATSQVTLLNLLLLCNRGASPNA